MWSRIRGHDFNVKQFQSAYNRGRLAHGYLLVGPPGVGKRLFARELAAALLCEKPPDTLTACECCASCKLVAAETHPDFLILRKPDDKLELPIDAMREFLASFGLKPSRGVRKVAFVEDAEDFNEESANAFLKTLEEPPPGAVLLLRACSVESQLRTILSRCQPIRFSVLSDAEMRAVLAEKGISGVKSEELIRMARGSPGRALALNDPELAEFQKGIIDVFAAPKFNHAAFAERWVKFVEEAGKDSPSQRARAALAIHFLLDILLQALRLSVGGGSEADALLVFSHRVGPEKVLAMLDAALEADRHVEQRVALTITLEYLADRLAA